MSELITIATFYFPTRAHVLKTRLEAEGIHVFLKNEMHAQIYNFQSNAIGGVQVQVTKNDLAKALEITQEFGIDNEYKATLTDKLVYWAYQKGEKINWFTNKSPLERFLSLLGLLLLLFSILITILFVGLQASSGENDFQQSVYSIVNNRIWCVDSVKQNGKLIPLRTTGAHLLNTNCFEEIEFSNRSEIKLPGINSHQIEGKFYVSESYLVIEQVNQFDSIYNGTYSFTYYKPILELKSRSTEIYCHETKNY